MTRIGQQQQNKIEYSARTLNHQVSMMEVIWNLSLIYFAVYLSFPEFKSLTKDMGCIVALARFLI